MNKKVLTSEKHQTMKNPWIYLFVKKPFLHFLESLYKLQIHFPKFLPYNF